ncbi:protein/nucleic acid deglycase DJ-1-like isoform X2 [Clavelina lepadiformis]|uniref:protein/nucleic acid deglycase DJ-1-like isoform X2 n=1 Tax=Clavelina lepadiformis TaxID=159417 RepID=UPI0040439350
MLRFFATVKIALHISVTVAGLTSAGTVTCSRQVKIVPDADLATAIQNGPYDAIVMPGGLQGANALAKAQSVKEILLEQDKANRVIGAICAAPIALKAHGIGFGKNITSYPSLKERMEGYAYGEACVVKDGNLITSRGPGTAFEFALSLVDAVCGKEIRDRVATPMLLE